MVVLVIIRDTFASIPLEKCVLCCECGVVSNSNGDRCRVCDGVGGLMNLARILDKDEPKGLYEPNLENDSQSN